MIHNVPPSYAALLQCQLCGDTGFGVAGTSVCLDCIGYASQCTVCDSEVTVTVYGDGVLQLDVSHAASCPRRAA
jgi:hypothetical protein